MLNLTEYLIIPTEIPGQALLQTLLGALSPDNSILLSALNQALDYRSIFGLTPL
jgi:hypothetical protein